MHSLAQFGFSSLCAAVALVAFWRSLGPRHGLSPGLGLMDFTGKFLICSHKAKPESCSVSLDLYQRRPDRSQCVRSAGSQGPGPQEGVGHFLDPAGFVPCVPHQAGQKRWHRQGPTHGRAWWCPQAWPPVPYAVSTFD